jgi:hypothetical protein
MKRESSARANAGTLPSVDVVPVDATKRSSKSARADATIVLALQSPMPLRLLTAEQHASKGRKHSQRITRFTLTSVHTLGMARAARSSDRRALIMLHCQQDFFSGGACAVEGAEAVLGPLAALRSQSWALAIHILDWHPSNNCMFPSNRPVSKLTQGSALSHHAFSC